MVLRGVADFHARHFYVSRHCGGGAYLFSVAAALPSPPSKEGIYQFIFPGGLTAWLAGGCPGIELRLPDCESCILTTTLPCIAYTRELNWRSVSFQYFSVVKNSIYHVIVINAVMQNTTFRRTYKVPRLFENRIAGKGNRVKTLL